MLERETVERFGIKVEAERQRRAMTQEYLAYLIGESILFVNLIEKGRLDIRLSDVAKIA